jgi:hypothetical protein
MAQGADQDLVVADGRVHVIVRRAQSGTAQHPATTTHSPLPAAAKRMVMVAASLIVMLWCDASVLKGKGLSLCDAAWLSKR